MAQDFKQLAEAAIKQCKVYQTCIQSLRSQLDMRKKAAVQLDMALLQKSVNALIKRGSLSAADHAATMELLQKDPNAALRAINALCEQSADASPIMKTASADVTGGVLVGHPNNKEQKVDERTAAYKAVAETLHI